MRIGRLLPQDVVDMINAVGIYQTTLELHVTAALIREYLRTSGFAVLSARGAGRAQAIPLDALV